MQTGRAISLLPLVEGVEGLRAVRVEADFATAPRAARAGKPRDQSLAME